MSSNKPEVIPVFADKKLNKAFNNYGYVVIKLISKEEVSRLSNFYLENPNPVKAGFHTTHFASDKEYKKKVHQIITETLAPAVTHFLPNYTAAFGNYMVKEPGGNNPMPLHADWTYVDETNATSLAIWMPLVDTTVENGQLGIIPFSQSLSHHIRGPRILQWQAPLNETLIKNMGVLLPLKAGEAVLYNHRVLHFSPPNNSSQLRPAVNLSLVPKNIQLLHYTIPEGKEGIHRYEIDDFNFFIYYDNFQVPEQGRLTGIDLRTIPMINDQVDAFISKHATPGIIRRVKGWF